MAKKRRSRPPFVDYDYDSLFSNHLEELDEYFVEDLLKTGKIKCLYAVKEIFSGDQLEIEIYPEFTKVQAKQEGIPPIDKKKQKENQTKLNTKRSEREFWRMAEHNFISGDFWFTLTYTNEPQSIEEAEGNIRKFLRNINGKRKRRKLPNAKYMYVTEVVSEYGEVVRVHHHVLMDSLLPWEIVEETWKHGRRNNFRLLEKDEDGICGAATYMTKFKADTRKRKYTKRWRRSTNLAKPPVRKHHQIRKKAVNTMARNLNYIQEYAEKSPRYSGYTYTRSEAYYNDYNARFYIRIRMRKEQNETAKSRCRSDSKGGCP